MPVNLSARKKQRNASATAQEKMRPHIPLKAGLLFYALLMNFAAPQPKRTTTDSKTQL